MNKSSIDALQYCLQAMEDGADLEAVLARYPHLAAELRPLLVSAAQARAMGAPDASVEAMRLGRQRLMQRAAQMRPSQRKSSILPRLQRFAFSVGLALIFLLSGTGLVRASSSTLPGDQLYPVKRTWEDMRLLFVFTPGHRDALEGEYERERLEEVSLVLQEGRVVPITFTGLITAQQDGLITVSGVPVAITSQTQFSGTQAVVGASIIVSGTTDMQGHVVAMHVQVLPPGSVVPLGVQPIATPLYVPGASLTPAPTQQGPSGEFHIQGTIQSMQSGLLVIDGRTVYLSNTEIEGSLVQGGQVEVEGYFTSDGRFIATKVETEDSGSKELDSQPQDSQPEKQDDSHDSGGEHSDHEEPETESSGD